MKLWVCQVRREVFVGGESQRCRHTNPHPLDVGAPIQGCGEMELIGGEPVEWCVVHGSPKIDLDNAERDYCEQLWLEAPKYYPPLPDCQFESQIRVGP